MQNSCSSSCFAQSAATPATPGMPGVCSLYMPVQRLIAHDVHTGRACAAGCLEDQHMFAVHALHVMYMSVSFGQPALVGVSSQEVQQRHLCPSHQDYTPDSSRGIAAADKHAAVQDDAYDAYAAVLPCAHRPAPTPACCIEGMWSVSKAGPKFKEHAGCSCQPVSWQT